MTVSYEIKVWFSEASLLSEPDRTILCFVTRPQGAVQFAAWEYAELVSEVFVVCGLTAAAVVTVAPFGYAGEPYVLKHVHVSGASGS